MSEVKIISPKVDLIEEIASRLPVGQKDFSKYIIVFPGKRPAHFLRKAIANRLCTSFVPPRVYSIDDFIDYILNELVGIRKLSLNALDSLSILYDVHLRANQKLGGDYYTSLDSFIPVGMKLLNELEEIALLNLSDQRIREVLSGIQYSKIQSLHLYYSEFYKEVDRRSYFTRSTKYCFLADTIDKVDFHSFEKIILAGFFAFTASEKKIIESLLKRENVSMVFQMGIGLNKQLENLHVPTATISEELSNDQQLHFYKAPDTHGQVFALAAILNEHLQIGEELDERTTIILPSAEALFPLLNFGISLIPNENYNVALGYPLSRTPIYGFLNSLMELITSALRGKFSPANYLKFVLHPYTKNIRFERRSDITRILFHTLEEYLVKHKAKMLFTLEDIEHDGVFFKIVKEKLAGDADLVEIAQLQDHLATIHNQTIRKFINIRSLLDFATKGIEIITYIYDHSTANLHPFFRPYVEKIIDAFEEIASSLMKDRKFDELTSYFSFFRNVIAAQTIPFSGTPLKGVQVLGLLETRNLKFDTMYILDVNDDIIPGKHTEDLLLPQPIRRMLGLETYHDREKLIEYYFDLAVRSAKTVHLFYAESGIKEKSRFVEKLIWQKQKTDKCLSSNKYEEVVKYRVRLANPKPEPIAKTQVMISDLHRNMNFSAWALDTYLACPLRFYYQNVLRLYEGVEASDEIDTLDIGALVHEILAKYFKACVGKRLTKEDLSRERLDCIIIECFNEKYGSDPVGDVPLMRKQISWQLGQFLEKYQIPMVEQAQVIVTAVEQKIFVEKNGYRFTGRIDRIELRGEKVVILDYKIGSSDKYIGLRLSKLVPDDPSTWFDAIRSFQLPMYMLLYQEMTKRKMENIISGYLFLGRNQIDASIEVGICDEPEKIVDIYSKIEQIIFKVIEQIMDVNFPFIPTTDLEAQCPRCPYTAICGTQWIRNFNVS